MNEIDTAALIKLLNVASLMAIMLAMGMQVKFAAVLGSTRPLRRLVLCVLANYVLVPAVTVGLLYLFQANPMVWVGFLVLAVCPGAPVSPPATTIARGNVAWAIGMMVILAGLSTVLAPALLGIMVPRLAPESNLHIDSLAIAKTLLIAQMLPLALGLAIHHHAPQLCQWVVKPLGILANVLLLLLVVSIVATQYETLAAIRLRAWIGMIMLLLASLGLGWLCGGAEVAIRKAMVLTTASRNVAVGLVIVTSNFADTPAVTAVVAYGLISIVGAFGCALVLRKFTAAIAKKDLAQDHAMPAAGVTP
jgi:BASS family bile acid:Na+ symporter